jgi:endonuclease/exonuclease/phosphatase family metal-dependent hydrolase
MRLVSYNIQYGRGKDGRIDLARIADELGRYDADVIALQEVEAGWRRSGNQHQPREIAARLPGYHWVYLPGFDLHGEKMRRQFGNMLLARQPIWQARLIPLPKIPVADEFNMDLGVLDVLLNSDAGPLRLLNFQLSSISAAERLLQIEALLAPRQQGGAWTGPGEVRGKVDWSNGEESPPAPCATILLGDLNAAPASAEYQRLMAASFIDAWRHLGLDEAGGITYPAQADWPLPLRIDYAFLDKNIAPKLRAIRVDQAAVGSDHDPLMLDLDATLLPPR